MHADTAEPPLTGIRWGLCCQFADSGVRFRQATHRYVATLPTRAAAVYLREIARANAIALAHAVLRCVELGVGAFRITSSILPLTTHPVSGYTLDALDWIKLEPRGASDFSSIAIGFSGMEPRRLELVDGLGQITRIELDNLVVNPEMGDDVFKLDVPPGVDVNGDG